MPKYQIVAAIFSLCLVRAACADQIVSVSIDAGSLNISNGGLDFQLNPGPLTTQSATLQILNFSGASWTGTQQDIGSVSGGPLTTSPVTIDNTFADNEDFESFQFGKSVSFNLDFGGPAVTAPNGASTSTTVFSLFLTDTTDASTYASGSITVNLNGSLVWTSNSPEIHFAAATPEPGSLALLIAACAIYGGFCLLRTRKRPLN